MASEVVAAEYQGKRYSAAELDELLAKTPLPLQADIIVEYADGLKIRPYRFASEEVTFARDGTAKLY